MSVLVRRPWGWELERGKEREREREREGMEKGERESRSESQFLRESHTLRLCPVKFSKSIKNKKTKRKAS